jgi:hypothetical protein
VIWWPFAGAPGDHFARCRQTIKVIHGGGAVMPETRGASATEFCDKANASKGDAVRSFSFIFATDSCNVEDPMFTAFCE